MSHEHNPFQSVDISDLVDQAGIPTIEESGEAVDRGRKRVAQAIVEANKDEAAAQAGNRKRLGRDWMSEVPIGQDQREDQPRDPVIAYSQEPEDGSDEAIEGFYSRYPYLGRPVSEDDFKRAEEFRVGMEERAQDKAGQALHDFYKRNPWL